MYFFGRTLLPKFQWLQSVETRLSNILQRHDKIFLANSCFSEKTITNLIRLTLGFARLKEQPTRRLFPFSDITFSLRGDLVHSDLCLRKGYTDKNIIIYWPLYGTLLRYAHYLWRQYCHLLYEHLASNLTLLSLFFNVKQANNY